MHGFHARHSYPLDVFGKCLLRKSSDEHNVIFININDTRVLPHVLKYFWFRLRHYNCVRTRLVTILAERRPYTVATLLLNFVVYVDRLDCFTIISCCRVSTGTHRLRTIHFYYLLGLVGILCSTAIYWCLSTSI